MSSPPLIPNEKTIQDHLERILGTVRFGRSPQIAQFLKFIVETTLAGEELKERTIGEALFRKAADWDTDIDSTVRTYANRLRTRLDQFYENEGREDSLRIEIPKGSYMPHFVVQAMTPEHPIELAELATPVPVLTGGRVALSAHLWIWVALALAVTGIAVAAFVVGSSTRTPQVVASIRLTRDGHEKMGPLVTDGVNLYFLQSLTAHHLVLASVSVTGGEIATFSLPIRGVPLVLDLLHGPSSLLVFGRDAQNQMRFWRWSPNDRLAPLEAAYENSFRITDSIHGEIMNDGHLRIREQGHPDRWISVPGSVTAASWEPQHRLLRLTVLNSGKNIYSIWSMRGIEGQPAPLKHYPKNARDGRWNANGNLYTFVSMGSEQAGHDISDVWIADSRPPASLDRPKLTRLTQGPISYATPIASQDGRHVFAIGYGERSELVEYDVTRNVWTPYLDGLDGFETDYSRDGLWIAYVRYPERTLWKVRSDGRGRTQLTFGAFQAIQPQWSPDGRHIAFMGQRPGGHHRIYVIPQNGGVPQELTAEPADQGIPTWSADGSKLVFGELLSEKPRAEMRVHVINVDSRAEWTLPESSGMWTPRWSPDGRWIAALTSDSRELLVLDTRTTRWRSLGRFQYIESPVWTADSKQIYVRTATATKYDNRTLTIERIDLRTTAATPVADLSVFDQPDTAWVGLTPAGTFLTLRSVRLSDIYSITVPD